MSFSSVLNLVPWLIFRAWIASDQFCWIRFNFNLLTWRELRGTERKRRWREGWRWLGGGGGRLFKGGDYFKCYHQRGATVTLLTILDLRALRTWCRDYTRGKGGDYFKYYHQRGATVTLLTILDLRALRIWCRDYTRGQTEIWGWHRGHNRKARSS